MNMMNQLTLAGSAAMLPLLSYSAQASETEAARPPNVLLIVVDDLGYADLGVLGATDMITPHMDSLAHNGVRFTDGYVTSPQCAPSRAGLMTGRYQNRFGLESNEQVGWPGIPLDQPVISEHFKDAGYVTGMIGKWGLNNFFEGHPPQRGFDESFWNASGNVYFPNMPTIHDVQMRRGNEKVELKEYSTDAFGREAVAFINRNAEHPFFLKLSFVTPHQPNEAKPEDLDRFAHIEDENRRIFLAKMICLDDNIGYVLDALRQHNLERDTLIIFLSDNGGFPEIGSSNYPLWGTKSSMGEGGIRIPFIIQWKGHLPAGKVYKNPIISLDILPTSLAAVGVAIDPAWKLDGVNLLPYLTDEDAGIPHEALYWRFNFPRDEPDRHGWAIRKGDWKLMRNSSRPNNPQPVRLFNLGESVREGMVPGNDLIEQYPEIAQQLLTEWKKWDVDNVQQLTAHWERTPGSR